MTRTTTSVCQPTGHGRLRPIRAKRWQGDVVKSLVCGLSPQRWLLQEVVTSGMRETTWPLVVAET